MSKKRRTEGASCPYSRILRRMPPLVHNRNPGGVFAISHSQVVRFIIHAMGESTRQQGSWSDACKVFYQAGMNRVLVYDHASNTWQGHAYVKGQQSPRVRRLVEVVKAADASSRSRNKRTKNRRGN